LWVFRENLACIPLELTGATCPGNLVPLEEIIVILFFECIIFSKVKKIKIFRVIRPWMSIVL
jgi:hypothetical protein